MRYINDRFLPDKAIDLMDEAGALVQLRRGASVEARDVADVAARWSGVPLQFLSETESEALLGAPPRIPEAAPRAPSRGARGCAAGS